MAAWRVDASIAGVADGIGNGVPAVASRLQRMGTDGFTGQGEWQV
jgi:hypothetical protein